MQSRSAPRGAPQRTPQVPRRTYIKWVCALIWVMSPIIVGLTAVQSSIVRDNFDVYSQLMQGPTHFVFPLVITAIACTGLGSEIAARNVSNRRSRLPAMKIVGSHLARIAAAGATIGFFYAFLPFCFAYLLWPALGNPSIDPGAYGMTPSSAEIDSFNRATFSSFLRNGPVAFGGVYSSWVAFGGLVYAVIGAIALLVMKNRFVALALPFLIYFVGTLVAALSGSPQLGFLYGLFPYGLVATPVWTAIGPTLGLGVASAIACLVLLQRADTLENLS